MRGSPLAIGVVSTHTGTWVEQTSKRLAWEANLLFKPTSDHVSNSPPPQKKSTCHYIMFKVSVTEMTNSISRFTIKDSRHQIAQTVERCSPSAANRATQQVESVFWNMTPCHELSGSRRFGHTAFTFKGQQPFGTS